MLMPSYIGKRFKVLLHLRPLPRPPLPSPRPPPQFDLHLQIIIFCLCVFICGCRISKSFLPQRFHFQSFRLVAPHGSMTISMRVLEPFGLLKDLILFPVVALYWAKRRNFESCSALDPLCRILLLCSIRHLPPSSSRS